MFTAWRPSEPKLGVDGRDPCAPGRAAERRDRRARRADPAGVRADVVGAARRLRARRALHGRRRRGGLPRPDLMRMTGTPGPLHELDAAAFWRSGPTSWAPGGGSRSRPAPVPFATLAEVLRLARRHRAGLNVELKNLPGSPGSTPTDATAERLAAVLRGARIARPADGADLLGRGTWP